HTYSLSNTYVNRWYSSQKTPILSHVVVEEKLIWMRAQGQRIKLLALVGDPHVQKVLSEDIALQQEIVIALQGLDRLIQTAENLRHFGHFFRRQFVEVLIHWLAGIDLILNAIQTRHHHRGKGQIGIGGRIGRTIFNGLGFWTFAVSRNTDLRAAV